MGTIASRKGRKVIKNTAYVIAIEIINASQALDFRKLKAGKGTDAAYKLIRKIIDPVGEDRVMYEDIERIVKILNSENFK